MHLYMSGTPRNDPYQTVENRMNTHRLFSMHGDYEKAVLRWVKDLRAGIMNAEDYLRAYPQHRDNIKKRDAGRRQAQREYGRSLDWDTAEILEQVCQRLDGKPYPKAILLDSGAFTAWNKGEVTTVDQVKRKYSNFMREAGDLFDEIWMINLDVIPGERGRDPTPEELDKATVDSDANFEILVQEFGHRVLPVFHQGESWARLAECVDQVRGKSNYICVSPRNDLPEGKRVEWSRDCHGMITRHHPGIMTHGLATTGNRMVRQVPWFSGDSAAWVQHGGYGMIDIFHDEAHAFGRKREPHYMNYFVSLENVHFDLSAAKLTKDGYRTGFDLGLTMGDSLTTMAQAYLDAGVDPDHFPLGGGHIDDWTKHYMRLSDAHREFIRERVEALGFPFEVCIWDSRVRNLICMAEFVTFAEWAKQSEKKPSQMFLGDF